MQTLTRRTKRICEMLFFENSMVSIIPFRMLISWQVVYKLTFEKQHHG
jgi:hypothetical protein